MLVCVQLKKLVGGYSGWQEWHSIGHQDLMLQALRDLERGLVTPNGTAFKSHCKLLRAEGYARDAMAEALSGSNKKSKLTWEQAKAKEPSFCSEQFILNVRELLKKGEIYSICGCMYSCACIVVEGINSVGWTLNAYPVFQTSSRREYWLAPRFWRLWELTNWMRPVAQQSSVSLLVLMSMTSHCIVAFGMMIVLLIKQLVFRR